MWRGIRWQAGVLGLSAALSACAVVFGFDELRERTDATVDASPPADGPDGESVDAGVEAGPLCRANLPEPPPDDDPRSDPHYCAISWLGFRQAGASGGGGGLDLDCHDTRSVGESRCRTGGAPLADQLVVDAPGGIDNLAVPMFEGIRTQLGFDLPKLLPQLARSGVLGGVFTIYSPSLDGGSEGVVDGRNNMFFQPARGLRVDNKCDYWRPDADAGDPDAGLRPLSRNDAWCIDKAYLTLGSSAAWVRDGVVTGMFPRMVVPLSFFPSLDAVSYVQLDSALVTGRVRRESGQLRLDGTIAGRWTVRELVQQFAAHLSPPDAAACTLDPLVADFFTSEMCHGLDVRTGFVSESDVDCNALSFSVDFEAYEVSSAGASVPYASRVDACRDGGAAPDSSFYYDCPAR